ncbi:MAG: hypothetical protein MZV64_35095 [Ignavibacteriales bacterium]|nr:hypothetical protein [Ignavibacteriales bacterium]
MAREILLYNKERVFAFVLALGEVDDLKYAAAAGAINFGFPVIADTVIPEILPTGVTTYEHVVSHAVQQDRRQGRPGTRRTTGPEVHRGARRQGQGARTCRCPGAVRLRLRRRSGPQGGPARRVRRQTLALPSNICTWQSWMKSPTARSKSSALTSQRHPGTRLAWIWASSSRSRGGRCRQDFEPVLERQVHYFVNGASGIQHVGQRDIAWIRISQCRGRQGLQPRASSARSCTPASTTTSAPSWTRCR